MNVSNREAAKALIQKLQELNGWASAEDREYLQNTRPGLLRSLDGARRLACTAAAALSQNLYSKTTRFIYELIQNADDNKYSGVKKLNELPSLTFTLCSGCIVIESNEDGFEEANVQAICSIGESTKTNVQGFIGEKGIGFKSVFKVARKVHIQSEPYSFAFEYDRKLPDGALGMVTPLQEEYSVLPDGIGTRMILHLREDIKEEDLFQDLENLPDTLLLFVRNLKRLTFKVERDGKIAVEKIFELTTKGNRACIKKFQGGKSVNLNYWIARRTVTDMPEDEVRMREKILPEGESNNETKNAERIKTAEVVLGFPIDENDAPIVENQHVYAFLPLSKVGFKFLIQSDFITQASRESVFDRAWNRRLLIEIVRLFRETVNDFLEHNTLKHQWVRYLSTDPVPDEFWSMLQRDLFDILKDMPVLLGEGGFRSLPKNFRIVPDSLRYGFGKPLLLDCPANCKSLRGYYVSESYDWDVDHPILRKLGVMNLSFKEFVHRLDHDLDIVSKARSRMRSESVDSHWHTKVAVLLKEAIKTSKELEKEISQLPLIPLIKKLESTNDNWVRPQGASIFFPTCCGIEIPSDLPLALVQPQVLRNPARVELFKELKISTCEFDRILPLIEKAHTSENWTVEKAVEHLKFIFWNHNQVLDHKLSITAMSIDNYGFQPKDLSKGWTYRPKDENTYSAATVIGNPIPDLCQSTMNFLHPLYYDVFSTCESRYNKTGIMWLERVIGIKCYPMLWSRSKPRQPSEEVLYISAKKPELLLGVLKQGWSSIQYRPNWLENFKSWKIAVPVLHSEAKQALDTLYLPLPCLKTIVSRIGLESDFGFIRELDGISDEAVSEWSFLHQYFGVGIKEDFRFWMLMLKKAQSKEMDIKAVSEIYSGLQRNCRTEQNKIALRSMFGTEVSISAFSFGSGTSPRLNQTKYMFFPPAKWVRIVGCVWEAPEWYTNHYRISKVPEYRDLQPFFLSILNIKRMPQTADFLSYLAVIKKTNRGNFRKHIIRNLYDELHSAWMRNESCQVDIKERLQEESLICDSNNNAWYAPSDCVWVDDTIQLVRKFSIATQYAKQKSFFVDCLGVTTPNIEMHIETLKQKAVGSLVKEEIKQIIKNICQFDLSAETLETLSDCKCFPVRLSEGSQVWMDCNREFVIADRREYEKYFSGEIDILDFSLEDIHSMESFLLGLGLKQKFLSRCVEIKTRATGNSIEHNLTANLRKKAYAICRYAAHMRSQFVLQDPLRYFQILKNLNVIVSDDITRTLTISRSWGSVTVPTDAAFCHLEEERKEEEKEKGEDGDEEEVEEKEEDEPDKLNLFVPRDLDRFQVCLLRYLPLKLLNYLGLETSTAGELVSIISANTLTIVDTILDDAGIVQIDGVERPTDELIVGSIPLTPPHFSRAITEILSQNLTPGQNLDSLTPSRPPAIRFRSSSLSTPATSIFDTPATPDEQNDRYKQLLDVITECGRSISALPNRNSTLESFASENALSNFAVESAVSSAREFKIGAAGELFVFEWLNGLRLPGFGLSNWQSKMRSIIRKYDGYSHINTWPHPETSDFIYEDKMGKLTKLLIDHDYLDLNNWKDARPTYFIEVKSTTSFLDTQFYVTQSQVECMERMQFPEQGASSELYLLVRVFKLGLSGMGVKLYLDPATHRLNKELIFKAEEYKVTPAVRF